MDTYMLSVDLIKISGLNPKCIFYNASVAAVAQEEVEPSSTDLKIGGSVADPCSQHVLEQDTETQNCPQKP